MKNLLLVAALAIVLLCVVNLDYTNTSSNDIPTFATVTPPPPPLPIDLAGSSSKMCTDDNATVNSTASRPLVLTNDVRHDMVSAKCTNSISRDGINSSRATGTVIDNRIFQIAIG
jgi:hypothetical protein